MSTDKEYIDTPVELEDAALKEVKKLTSELMTKIKDAIGEIVWQVANDYINDHLESDCISNLQANIRHELTRCSCFWTRNKDDFWGKSIRAKIFDEYKDEILPLIKDEQMQNLMNEVKTKQEQIEFLSKMRYRY